MMALESYLVANGLADGDIDLSEEAVPWHVLTICREQLGDGRPFGWTVGRGTRDDSGYAAMMTGISCRGSAPNLERDVPYYRELRRGIPWASTRSRSAPSVSIAPEAVSGNRRRLLRGSCA